MKKIMIVLLYLTPFSQGVQNNPITLKGISKVMILLNQSFGGNISEYEKYGLSVKNISR